MKDQFEVGTVMVERGRVPVFWEIVKRPSPHYVIVRECDRLEFWDDESGQNGTCVPVPGSYEQRQCWRPIRRKINREYNSIRTMLGGVAFVWDGNDVAYWSD